MTTIVDSTAPEDEAGLTDVVAAVGEIILEGESVGYGTVVLAKQGGSVYVGAALSNSLDAARSTAAVSTAVQAIINNGVELNKGSSSSCAGSGSGSALAASVMAGGFLTAGLGLAAGAAVAL